MESSCKQHFQVFVSDEFVYDVFILFGAWQVYGKEQHEHKEDNIVWVKYPFKSTKDI